MPIVFDEARRIFVSFLTSTSTRWQWLTDIPSQGHGCLTSSPSHFSPPCCDTHGIG